MTLIDFLHRASARFQESGIALGQGTAEPFDEAAWLALWRLGLPLDGLDDVRDRPLAPDELAALWLLVETRISTRQPAAYLTGEAWLQGVPFHADARAIVPRSLIAEVLAEGLIDPWLPDPTRRVLDLCTGNGSLAVLAALAWQDMRVDAADLSAEALALAASNVRLHGLGERIELRQGDGLAAVAGRRYDLILCNPPYVTDDSMAALPPEFRAEPALALAGGADGMDFIRGLLAGVAEAMHEEAVLVLEVGQERAHFEAAFPALEAVWLPTAQHEDGVLLLTRAALQRQAESAR